MGKKTLYLMICLSLFAFCPFMPQGALAEDVKIITNSSVPAGSVDAATVKKIYSGYTTKWPDGTRIIVTIMENAPYHEEFLKTYVGKNSSQFTATWKKIMFTGKGKFPTDCNSEQVLLDLIAQTPGAIGYVKEETALPGITVQQ